MDLLHGLARAPGHRRDRIGRWVVWRWQGRQGSHVVVPNHLLSGCDHGQGAHLASRLIRDPLVSVLRCPALCKKVHLGSRSQVVGLGFRLPRRHGGLCGGGLL